MSNESRQLVRRMTLEEKASMVSGGDFWHTDAVERLAIPAAMVSDGPHGLRKQADEADHLGVNESIQAVCFPTASGTASSFDRNLLARLGETLGEECQAEGVSILLGPAVNIKRSPLCGRNFEYFSEDPYLAGELAQSYINGVQSKHVGTSIKHFAVNSQEKRRMSVSAVLDERTLREIYLPAFEIAVRKAQPWTVMCSYNKVNGCFASEHDYLLNQILRHEWDFQGYVMSDWGACDDRVKGIPSGLDLEMPSSGDNNTKKILAAVHSGKLEESALDTACERILEKVQYFYDHWDKNAKFDRAADHEKARDAAVQSMVLLKNNGVLPLSKDQNIAFIGEFAKTPRYQGGGSSHINSYKVTGALEAAEDYAQVRYAKGFPMDKDAVNEADFAEAVKLAQESDVAVVFAGLPDNMESEGFDRQHLNLPQCQTQLIERIAQVQKNLVVVLHNGSPVLLPWLDQAGAVLESYLGGEAVGEAQCMLLFGAANPSGKLAETFPLSLEDTPCYGNYPGNEATVEHREGIYVGYRYYDTAGKDVLFPFGHGLSYTTFRYADMKLSRETMDENGSVTVSFRVTNTGDRDGAEAVQIYVAPQDSAVFRADQELKGFDKVFLKAGESKAVSVTLDSRAFAYYHTQIKDWYCEPGAYEIRVGASSRDIRLSTQVQIQNSRELSSPYDKTALPAYYQARVHQVPDHEFQQLLGFQIPEAIRGKGKPFTFNSTFDEARDTKWGRRIIRLIRIFSPKDDGGMGNTEMMEAMAVETPIRSMVNMSQGALSEEMGQAILDLLNDRQTGKALRTLMKGGLKLLKRR